MKKALTVRTIGEITAAYFDVTWIDLISARGNGDIALARHVAMLMARRFTDHSEDVIGRLFGGRDGKVVRTALRKLDERLKLDVALASDLIEIAEAIFATRTTIERLQLSQAVDVDPVAIAENALISPRRVFSLSVQDTLAVCRALVTRTSAPDSDLDEQNYAGLLQAVTAFIGACDDVLVTPSEETLEAHSRAFQKLKHTHSQLTEKEASHGHAA